jgi:hypothetical protein
MESLHPAAQVTAIIVIGLIVCVFLLSTTTTFFDDFNKKNK